MLRTMDSEMPVHQRTPTIERGEVIFRKPSRSQGQSVF
jgi:hypothetical protein